MGEYVLAAAGGSLVACLVGLAAVVDLVKWKGIR